MISQYFHALQIMRSPIVLDHLRRRFDRFKLGAHVLDLRRLLFQLSR
jgi:hypothetical protein